jgi:two-component system cell cycle response regulator
MTGRILVVDDVATNRIVMKVKLSAACYEVEQADSGAAALRAAQATRPDLILLDMILPDMSGLDVCRRLKQEADTADIPVIMVTGHADAASKVAALEAGADDFLAKPVDEVALLARVRSSLRARDTVRELRERGESGECLGFAEAVSGFEPQDGAGRVRLIAPGPRGAVAWKSSLDDQGIGDVRVVQREAALTETAPDTRETADVIVIAADLAQRNEGLRLLSELRSRPGTRHAATLMVLPDGDTERAAIALDLGASDILYEPVDTRELALRIGAQLRRKRQADRLRESLRAGLELAVTDSLTGLHNRRYALFRMERMLARPGRGVAGMMLDLDHFKTINDTYGHGAGDAVLRLVARRLRAQLRSGDLLARIGGEEFLVALPDADRAAALDCAERLRHAVSGTPFEIGRDGVAVRVTMSVGLALSRGAGGESPECLIARADGALYGAKSGGRDKVAAAGLPAA